MYLYSDYLVVSGPGCEPCADDALAAARAVAHYYRVATRCFFFVRYEIDGVEITEERWRYTVRLELHQRRWLIDVLSRFSSGQGIVNRYGLDHPSLHQAMRGTGVAALVDQSLLI